MNSYQMVLHRPVETAPVFGNFALDRPAMSVLTSIPVFNELGDATCPISRLFVHMESHRLKSVNTIASIDTNPPNMLQIALDEY